VSSLPGALAGAAVRSRRPCFQAADPARRLVRHRRAVLNSSPISPSLRRTTRKSYFAVARLNSRRLLEAGLRAERVCREGEDQLNVRLDLVGIDRAVEVPELDRLAVEEAVEAEAVVAASAAALRTCVAVAVPRSIERLQPGRLASRKARHELRIDRLAILPEATARDLKDVLRVLPARSRQPTAGHSHPTTWELRPGTGGCAFNACRVGSRTDQVAVGIAGMTGRSRTKMQPFSGRFWTRRVPPCASTAWRAIARPRPKPLLAPTPS
jgi:hypothetical protein